MNNKILQFSNQNIPHTPEERQDIINNAAKAYEQFLDALKFNWRDDPNANNTPMRVAKAYVNDLISGCYSEPPNITSFDNLDQYDGIVAQTNIPIVSLCSHHHSPFTGIAHVGYLPRIDGKVIGLSKLNRICDWFARRPSVQESLTASIHQYIDTVCENNAGVAVVIECKHTCCSNRGIKHNSTMRTSKMSGAFMDNNDNSRAEFYKFIEFAKFDK